MRWNQATAACVIFCATITATPLHAQRPDVFDSAIEVADNAALVCAAVVIDGQSFESQLEGEARWVSIEPRETGSNLATHAWRSLTLNNSFVMRLPNGGCSFSVERGDSDAVRARIVERLGARAGFELVSQEETRNGRAVRFSYCVREDFPLVLSIVAAERSSRPNVVVNLFRASARTPEFCAST